MKLIHSKFLEIKTSRESKSAVFKTLFMIKLKL